MTQSLIYYAQFTQHKSTCFRKLRVTDTCLIHVKNGSKCLQYNADPVQQVYEGGYALLHAGDILNISNYTNKNNLYLSDALIFDGDLIDQIAQNTSPPICDDTYKQTTPNIMQSMPSAFNHSYNVLIAQTGHNDLPLSILKHKVDELFIWLKECGLSIPPKKQSTLTEKLRTLLMSDLEAPWRAPDVARHFGMSEATFRRMLQKEDTSFSLQLQDVRVSFALIKLQTTQLPLAQIAYESGFSSQSRLSEAFKSRFNLSPRDIRGNTVNFDRIT